MLFIIFGIFLFVLVTRVASQCYWSVVQEVLPAIFIDIENSDMYFQRTPPTPISVPPFPLPMKTASYQLEFSCIFPNLLDTNGVVDASRLTIEPTPASSASPTALTNGGSTATSSSQSFIPAGNNLNTADIVGIALGCGSLVVATIACYIAWLTYKVAARQVGEARSASGFGRYVRHGVSQNGDNIYSYYEASK